MIPVLAEDYEIEGLGIAKSYGLDVLPIDEDNSAVIMLLFTSNPNITVIEAIIPT